jgi:uncharacterized damage-inducible protein DinB
MAKAHEVNMDKMTFLSVVRSTRAELDSAIASLSEQQMLKPEASGEMSVKDVLAHIAWFEREMIGLLEQRALAGSDLWNLPSDERNAVIYRLNRHRSLTDVRQEAKEVFQQLLKELENLDEAALDDPACFRDMPTDWSPRQLLAENTSEHYQHHLADINAWLAKQP